MEYTFKVTVSPTDQTYTYMARLFISAHSDDRHIGTEQIWETKVHAIDPNGSADARMWAFKLLRDITMYLEPDAWTGYVQGSGKSMSSLFEHQGHFAD